MNSDRICECGRKIQVGYEKWCKWCTELPRGNDGLPKWTYCCNCGGITNGGGNGHFVPPSTGDVGFFYCKPKDVCKTCNGKRMVESSTSGRMYYDAPMMVPCPTCGDKE